MATATLSTNMGFLNSNILFFPYATETVDVSSVDLEDISHPWNILPCVSLCPIVQLMNKNVLYKKTVQIPILFCRIVTEVSG